MAGRTSSLEQLKVIYINNNNVMDYTYPRLGLLHCWSQYPWSLVLCWRKMTTEYSSPYKVGLIYVGTKFAQSRLLWSEVAYGKLNFRGTVANANLAPHQPVQAIIQGGTRYVDFFWFLSRLDFRFGPFHFFPVFDSTCDLLPDSALKNVKAWYRLCFDSKPPNIPAYRPGTLVYFIRGVKVHGHMSHSSV